MEMGLGPEGPDVQGAGEAAKPVKTQIKQEAGETDLNLKSSQSQDHVSSSTQNRSVAQSLANKAMQAVCSVANVRMDRNPNFEPEVHFQSRPSAELHQQTAMVLLEQCKEARDNVHVTPLASRKWDKCGASVSAKKHKRMGKGQRAGCTKGDAATRARTQNHTEGDAATRASTQNHTEAAAVLEQGCRQSSAQQDSEFSLGPAMALRPRRTTRKPCLTQRVWRPGITGQSCEKWREIGRSKGLSSDTEIAFFLMEHYEKVLSGQPTGEMCVHCNTPLTLACLVCHTKPEVADTALSDQSPVTPHSAQTSADLYSGSTPVHCHTLSASAKVLRVRDEGFVEAKTEPEEEITAAEGSESEPFLLEPDIEDEEMEEKLEARKRGKRRRGRPLGSGKKQLVTGSNPPKVKVMKVRKYKCTYEGCEAAFAKSSRLKIHTRIHTGEKPYVCEECNRAFAQNSGLKVHMQKHTGLRPFICDVCHAKFPTSSSMKQHMRCHTGEKPFECKLCNKTFRWSGHLTQHMRMHAGIKPFLCQDCGKSFAASSDLVKHKVTHTKDRPYKCNLCDKAYAFQHRLTAHKRSHTGDRPYLCSLCGAAFARAHNLTVHMRTHTGVKPYWCTDCGARFSDSGNFSKHKKTKHGTAAKISCNTKIDDLTKMVEEQAGSVNGGTDHSQSLPDMSQFSGTDSVKLPSMARMANAAAARKVGEAKYLKSGIQDHLSNGSPLPSVSTLHPHPQVPSGSDIADFKNLLPSLGDEQALSGLPSPLSPVMPMGSPPALLVQGGVSASRGVSPAVAKHSPRSGGGGDSCLSPLPPQQHDEVVFPHQYYNSYSYFYSQH